MGEIGDETKTSRLPNASYLRIWGSLLLLPILGVLFGIELISVIIGCLCGFLVFVAIVPRIRYRYGYPLKPILIAVAVQATVLTFSSYLTGTGLLPKFLSGSHGVLRSYANGISTMSVILPCANEGIYAVNTARSVGRLTPKEVLAEIIIVDDGSTPPLESFFKENAPELLNQYPIKFIRHETFTGLINAKKKGGDAAVGDVLTFFDCHVLPRDYGSDVFWSDGIMSRISDNYKRVVVPSITDLDADKWEEIGRPKGVAKCYLSLDVDFRWFDSGDDYVPVMSGGLLAMSRRWWIETGGYDTGMIGWGGENIDQSLRIWLCGGEIVQATDSHVAHMWRTNDKPQTKAKYIVPQGAVTSNRYRVALAWMDDYVKKVNEFPVFSKFKQLFDGQESGREHNTLPDISSILEVKNRLQCRPFQWFVDRFSDQYFKGGVLPDKVFRIRTSNENLCLAKRNTGERTEHAVVAAHCSEEDPAQLWHFGNRNSATDTCCSGLRSYDTMYCLSGLPSGKAKANECNIAGNVNDQYVSLAPSGQIKFERSNSCLVLAADPATVLKQAQCDEKSARKEFDLRQVDQTEKYHIVETVSQKCLSAKSPSVELVACDSRRVTQNFSLIKIDKETVQIVASDGLCLDSGEGNNAAIITYTCYPLDMNNRRQQFVYNHEKHTFKNVFHPICLAFTNPLEPVVSPANGAKPVFISGCIVWNKNVKAEQQFKQIIYDDTYVFLRSGDFCLTTDNDAIVVKLCVHDYADEDVPKFLWSVKGSQNRLRHKFTDKCLDGNDHKSPILYPCYDTENDNQEWIDPGNFGIIKNARASMCLDYNPLPEYGTSTSSACDDPRVWETHNPTDSTEMRIYKDTREKLTDNEIVVNL